MKKTADKTGKTGSALGVLAGLIELSIGTEILSWIGNKENPAILGIITILLSVIAFISVRSAGNHVNPTNDRKLAIFLGILIPAAICFTTVGRLWYLPGTLLIVTSLFLGYEYWFCRSTGRSVKITSRKLVLNQIIGATGSLIILASVVLALSNRDSGFGLFESNIFVDTGHFRFEVLPMDIVRLTKISDSMITVENIEVRLVMIVYILLLLGSGIAFIASVVKSRFFTGIGCVLGFTGLLFFLIWLPEILSQTKLPSVRFENIIGSLGIGWYTSIVGMSLIMISSLFKIQRDNI